MRLPCISDFRELLLQICLGQERMLEAFTYREIARWLEADIDT
jgi:hypothetical protein